VDEAGVVHHRQPVQHWQAEVQQGGVAADAAAADGVPEALAALELHHHEGRPEALEDAQHAHDVGVAEPREQPCLLEEALQAPAEELRLGVRQRQQLPVGSPIDVALRVVLLDGQ
jgi:hypothetical protein